MSRKKIAASAFAAFVAIAQFYPATVRDNPPPSTEIVAPTEVHRALRRACYDCHSNETRWRWYSYVAPASWLVAKDVHDARQRMNFSRWPLMTSPEVECYFKRRIRERTERDEMPPQRYILLHPSAMLTADEKASLMVWAASGCAGDR